MRFSERLRVEGLSVRRQPVAIWQMNITRQCNQACHHCHVDASPSRTEAMDDRTMERCFWWVERLPSVHTVDLTGGAPELHPRFTDMVECARRLGRQVMVRHNLTVTIDRHPWLPEYFARQRVELVSSLPYYQPYFTDKQRGHKVFEKSMASLRLLNERGYGVEGSGLVLNLVYNPVGAFLPPFQAELEATYKRELAAGWGVTFNKLWTLTNMPINRFRQQLERLGTLEAYMDKLEQAFNPCTVEGLMCRDLLSIGYDGRIFDCDFNQMLDMEVGSVFDDELPSGPIRFDQHCFGCTAGAGFT